MFENVKGDVVGMKLPNGQVKVVKCVGGQCGEVLESSDAFYKKYQKVNESGSALNCVLLDSING